MGVLKVKPQSFLEIYLFILFIRIYFDPFMNTNYY